MQTVTLVLTLIACVLVCVGIYNTRKALRNQKEINKLLKR